MISRNGLAAILLSVVALLAAGCGDDGSDDPPSDSPTTDAPADGAGGDDDSEPGGDEADLIVPDVGDGDDLATQLLGKVFGLPGSFITAEERDCLSAGLADFFPDGVVPDDIVVGEELGDAISAAAEPCGLNDFGS
ncbi:MAG: hypothetical protein AAF548_19815 [Actinomycetota bacterium]